MRATTRKAIGFNAWFANNEYRNETSMSASKIVRLEATGPEGASLEPMAVNPEDYAAEVPEQSIYYYHNDEELGLYVGVWTTTSMQEAFGPYPGDEFMHVVEGRVDMLDEDGTATPVEEGQSFFVRNGIPASWLQKGDLRKFFLIYDNPKNPRPTDLPHAGGVMVPNPLQLRDEVTGDGGLKHCRIFTSDDGKCSFDFAATSGAVSQDQTLSRYEFWQVVSGSVEISEEDGTSQTFQTDQHFFALVGASGRFTFSPEFSGYCIAVEA